MVGIYFTFLRADATETHESENAWATMLVAIDVGLNYPLAISLESKDSSYGPYVASVIIMMMEQLCHRKVGLRRDGETERESRQRRSITDLPKQRLSCEGDRLGPEAGADFGL